MGSGGGGRVELSLTNKSDGNNKVEEVIAVRNSLTSFFVTGPEEGPTNVSCKAVAWTEEKGKMNVTIEWKVMLLLPRYMYSLLLPNTSLQYLLGPEWV